MMEYCELGDLSLFIKKREKLSTNPATHDMARKYPNVPNSGLNEVVIRHFLKQLSSALKFLRESNLVHRDVKPQNLLLLPSPEFREVNKLARPILTASQDSLVPVAGLASLPMLKLADFGFARVLPSTSLAETLCGSPLYMAPEILRYERYDAKADLWSVGTVLFEMIVGRPPFRASNHVELLRKIEAAEDVIKFPRETTISSEMKGLTRALLKRNPVERISFENFFAHPVIISSIPGLVEDDIPKPEASEQRSSSKDTRAASKSDDPIASPRKYSFRRHPTDNDQIRDQFRRVEPPSSAAESAPSRQTSAFSGIAAEARKQAAAEASARTGQSSRNEPGDNLVPRRPQAQPSTSAPSKPGLYEERRRGISNASLNRSNRESSSPTSAALANDSARAPPQQTSRRVQAEEREKAAQDVAFERDYVVVEKKHVEVNAFADEMAANPRLGGQGTPLSPKSGQIVRRATQQGNPTSTTGAIPAAPSRTMQIAQGTQRHYHERGTSLSASPGSTASFITKAIQDASLRLLGIKYPAGLTKGASPPELYNPYPAYPTPSPPVGLISSGKQSTPVDEDARVAQLIEEHATRSDVVYGFAEVKYKQLVPLAPSAEHGLGGTTLEDMPTGEEDVLTVEAIVSLSEEALVLYVKALTLLAKSMDIASLWWARKNRGDQANNALSSTRDSVNTQTLSLRINSAVQWVRSRFNEVLEKAEVVRLRLMDAQKRLPDDHPSHPSNHPQGSESVNGASAEGVFLTVGVTAEKLMYDRALEMSRTAAINEITNEDLAGCEISYVTAIRMLEAVLDNDEDAPKRRLSANMDESGGDGEDGHAEINADDQQAVQKSEFCCVETFFFFFFSLPSNVCWVLTDYFHRLVIHMIRSRLTSVRSKVRMISNASKAQQQSQPQSLIRRRSGDVTPRSVPSYSS